MRLGTGGIFLGEGGADEGRHHATALAAGVRQQVAHGMHAATLPGGVSNLADGSFEAFMRIGDHQLDATQAAAPQAAQEVGPECFCLRRADRHAKDLPPAVGVDAGGDRDGDADNTASLTHLDVSCIEPEIRPIAFQRALKKAVDLVIDLAAQAGHRALAE